MLSEEVLRQVSVFILLYTLLFVLGAVALAFLEKDFVVAFTASAQAIGNIGPGLGEVGPMGSYAGLHPSPSSSSWGSCGRGGLRWCPWSSS